MSFKCHLNVILKHTTHPTYSQMMMRRVTQLLYLLSLSLLSQTQTEALLVIHIRGKTLGSCYPAQQMNIYHLNI